MWWLMLEALQRQPGLRLRKNVKQFLRFLFVLAFFTAFIMWQAHSNGS